MPKPITRKELVKRFQKLGFDGPYAGGKHSFMVRDALRVRIPNPHSRDIGSALLGELLRQANISKEEWGDK